MKPEIIQGMPFAEYAAVPAEHATGLKSMLVSPLQYRWDRDHSKPDARHYRVGRLTHTAILEPDRLLTDYVVFTGKVRNGKAWDEFRAANADKTIVSRSELDDAMAMGKAARRNRFVRDLIADGEPEVCVFWDECETGLRCKSRLDWLKRGGVVEIKTTAKIEPYQFSAEFARRGYGLQCGMYSLGHRIATDSDKTPFFVVAVQNAPPYDVVVYQVPHDVLEAGWDRACDMIRRVAECQRANHWPGVAGDEMHELQLPKWASGDGKAELVLEVGGQSVAVLPADTERTYTMGKLIQGHIMLAFPSNFIKAADLRDKDVTVLVDRVEMDSLPMNGGKKETKVVLTIKKRDGSPIAKKLVLNKTNATAIAKLYGPKVEAWKDKPITLYPTTTTFGRQTVECVRVRVTGEHNGTDPGDHMNNTDEEPTPPADDLGSDDGETKEAS